MKKFLLTILFSIFLISNVNAIVVYGDWQNGQQSIQINQGESVNFNADFFSMNPPMTINIKLYDSNYNLVHSFESNKQINANSYSHTYTITEQIYRNSGSFELILTGSDRFPSEDSHTLYLTVVKEENHPPISRNVIATTNEDTSTSITLSASDPDGDVLSYTIVSAPQHGTLSGSGQTRTYSPNANWYGTDSFSYKVFDGEFYSNPATATINVNSVNDAPEIISEPITRIDEGENYVYQVRAQDVENDELVYSLTQAPTWISINSATGKITGTAPFVDADKSYSISVKVSDSSSYDTQSYTLIVENLGFEDNVAPEVIITYPEDGKTYNYHINELRYTATDDVELEKCWYIVNEEEIIVPCNKPIQTTSVEGENILEVYAQDTSGNIGGDRVVFFVELQGDTTPPVITIISPENKEYEDSEILFKIKTNEFATHAWFNLDGVSYSLETSDNINFEKILKVANGNHEAVFYAKDLAGNTGTARVEFLVDTDRDGDGRRHREIPEDEFYNAKYLSQFVPLKIIYEEPEKKAPKAEEELKIWENILFWLLVLIIILAILITLLLIRRLRQRNV